MAQLNMIKEEIISNTDKRYLKYAAGLVNRTIAPIGKSLFILLGH